MHIVIGSDSKCSMLSFSDVDDKGDNGAKKSCKLKSVISSDSEKENAPQKSKKKRKQFKHLFGLAHY